MSSSAGARTGGVWARGLLIDMDGVLWRGDEPLDGVPEFIALLRQRSIAFILVTNNATKTPERVQARMAGMGVSVTAEQVLTSGLGAAAFLRSKLADGAAIYAIGEQGLHRALEEAGFRLQARGESAEAVVVGMDTQLTWEKLSEAAYALAAGALFLGTNPDRSFPTERGLAPGNGAILAALQAATGRSPMIFGKPEPYLFQEGLKRLGTPAEETLVVGDRLETDILGGRKAGLSTILLLTGVTQPADLQSSSLQPDWVFPDLPALTAALARGGADSHRPSKKK